MLNLLQCQVANEDDRALLLLGGGIDGFTAPLESMKHFRMVFDFCLLNNNHAQHSHLHSALLKEQN